MIATINQDVIHIIEKFKKLVNPNFKPTNIDIENIKRFVQVAKTGRANENGGDILYCSVDYEGLKRHNVQSFNFKLEDYYEWEQETFDLLKKELLAKYHLNFNEIRTFE